MVRPVDRQAALAPERRIGFHPAPADRHPPRVLVSARWQWAVPRLALLALVGGVISALQGRLRLLSHLVVTALLGGLGLFGLGIWQALRPKLQHIDIALPGLPAAFDGFTIAQLSDFHLDQPLSPRNAQWAVTRTLELQPDLVVITGDFVSHVIPQATLDGLLRQLHAPQGVFGIWGNHDYWVADFTELRALVQGAGIRLLENEHLLLTRGSDRLCLAGIDDFWEGHADLERALAGTPTGVPIILLAHEPDVADQAAERGVGLQLSGHTHGGQVALPLLGPAFSPRHGWRYIRGRHRIGDMVLYISNGLGGLPFRLGARPELTLIRLVPAD